MSKFLMKVVPDTLLRTASRQLLVAKKNSPHIFFAAGLAGVITSTVLACRATLKLSDTLDIIQKEIDQLKPEPEILVEDENTKELVITENPHLHQDTIIVYTKASWKVLRLYAPAVIIGGISITALAGAHVQLSRRNTALMSAYAVVAKAYEEYRIRVQEEVGAERELELYHGTQKGLVKNKDGEVVEAKLVDPTKISPHAKFFDEYSNFWKKDPDVNHLFVKVQENYMNERLQAYGHVFLNEVYDSLGIPRTREGSVVGWLRFPEKGDGFIDFGMQDAYNAGFVNHLEPSVLLNFNVDGVIWDKI